MATTGLLGPAALRFRVRRRGQTLVSVYVCRFAVLGVPHVSYLWVKTRSQGSDVVGKQQNTQILVYLLVTYVPGGTSSKAKTLGF